MSVNCRWPGVWSIRLTMPTRSAGPNSSSSAVERLGAELGAQVQPVADAQRAGVGAAGRARWRAGARTCRSRPCRRRRSEPTRSASKTVVIPVPASSASWARIAAACGQRTPGRGSRWRSRLSVWSSIRPGAEEVAAAVLGPARHARPGVDRGDAAVADHDAADHAVALEDEAGVGERQLALLRDAEVVWHAVTARRGREPPWATGAAMQSISHRRREARWRNSAPTGSAGTRPPAASAMASTCRGCRGRGPSWSRRRRATASTPR